MKAIIWTALALAIISVQAAPRQALPGHSQLTFEATQAGARFEGAFNRFTAKVDFDAQDPSHCSFDVVIDTASVDTQDGERDDVIKSADLFNVQRFPQARYVANRCSVQGQRFVGHGKLTLRNVTRDVPIAFVIDDQQILKGSAQLKRLDFGVGQGEWQGTEWVGNEVVVKFSLRLR